MVTANAYQKYKAQEVNMANPVALIVMLYNGCIKKLKLARIAIEKKDYVEANTDLQKAQDIISELINSLDFKFEISKNLLSLYEFMYHEIVQINIRKNTERIEPVVQMLSNLRDAWMQVEKTCRQSSSEIYENES
jgi:flagellar biosynthetic protein FliS